MLCAVTELKVVSVHECTDLPNSIHVHASTRRTQAVLMLSSQCDRIKMQVVVLSHLGQGLQACLSAEGAALVQCVCLVGSRRGGQLSGAAWIRRVSVHKHVFYVCVYV
jgi:hypothetical protein